MAQAALQAGVHPRHLSFKHTVQLWTEWLCHGLAGMAAAHAAVLFQAIAQQKVGNRPGRIEPRARKQLRLYGYLPNPSS
jgi:hypothetical protein